MTIQSVARLPGLVAAPAFGPKHPEAVPVAERGPPLDERGRKAEHRRLVCPVEYHPACIRSLFADLALKFRAGSDC